MPAGRPSKYSEELADAICILLAGGQSLAEICRRDDMPNPDTIYLWIANDKGGFSDKYARAREAQAEHFAAEIIEISDDGTNDWMERRQGEETVVVADHEHIQRSKLRVDSRKWLMARMAPKKYGDSIAVTGAKGGPIQVENLTPEQKAIKAVALIDETFGAKA